MNASFSTFPNGSPGVGLLLLRSLTGVMLCAEGLAGILQSGTFALLPISAIVSGLFLLPGMFTRLAGILAILQSTATFVLLTFANDEWLPLRATAALLAVMSASVTLLGPGAFSFDNLLFGRREIIIPKLMRSERHD